MILYVAITLGILLLLSVLRVVSNMARSYWNLQFYRKQGAKIHYSPLLGFYDLFEKKYKENKKYSNLELIMHKAHKEGSEKGIIAVNQPLNPGCSILIYTSELAKDLLIQERHFIKNSELEEFVPITSFFYQNGDKAMNRKATYGRIFSFEKVESVQNTLAGLIDKFIKNFNVRNGISKERFTTISLNDFLVPLQAALANFIITGEVTPDIPPHIEELNTLFMELYHEAFNSIQNPLFIFFPEICKALKLTHFYRIFGKRYHKQLAIIKKMMKDHENKKELGDFILDRVVLHNRKCDEDGDLDNKLTMDEALGAYNLFYFAGTDTTMASTSAMICHMSDKKHLQQVLEKVNSEVYDENGQTTKDLIDNNVDLDLFVKEVLRLFSPLQYQQERVATKDVNLGKYTIKKGDRVFLMMFVMHKDADYYEDPYTFKPDRFTKENDKDRPKYQYLPFSMGKRICPGRHLGALMVKMLLTQFIKNYELERPEGQEYYHYNLLTARVESPLVNIRSK